MALLAVSGFPATLEGMNAILPVLFLLIGLVVGGVAAGFVVQAKLRHACDRRYRRGRVRNGSFSPNALPRDRRRSMN